MTVVPDTTVLAVLDALGWPDDRDQPPDPELGVGSYWQVATDVAGAVLIAGLRWLADDLDARADAVNPNPRYRPAYAIGASRLRELADQLDQPEEQA